MELHRRSGALQTFLEWIRIKAPTRAAYEKAVFQFLLFARTDNLPFSSSPEIDAAMAMFMDELYAPGEHVSSGRFLLAGFEHFFVEFSKKGSHRLTRAHASLDGWEKLGPPASRWPMARWLLL